MTGETETDSPRPSSRKPSERPSAAPLPLPFSLFLSFSQAPELLTCSCSNFKRQLYFSRRGTPLSPRRTLNLSRTRPGSSPQLVELAFVKSHARDFLERSTWQYAIPSSAPPSLSLSIPGRYFAFCILRACLGVHLNVQTSTGCLPERLEAEKRRREKDPRPFAFVVSPSPRVKSVSLNEIGDKT
jgi:hypothetical protein